MPIIGEIKKGRELGYKRNVKHIWQACELCGKERWVIYQDSYRKGKLCYQCAVHSEEFRKKQSASHLGRKASQETRDKMSRAKTGANHPRWKGGKVRDGKGYINVRILLNSPYYPMVGSGKYVLEHRLIMAQHLGRCLEVSERVHHLNGIKDDNRIKNLALLNKRNHSPHLFPKLLQKRIRELEGELATRQLL